MRKAGGTLLLLACAFVLASGVATAATYHVGGATPTVACPAPNASLDYALTGGVTPGLAKTDDVSIECSLEFKTVTVKDVHAITVDGTLGGGIKTGGIGGTKLLAGVTTSSNVSCAAWGNATSLVTLTAATIEDQNANGGIVLRACGGVEIDQVGGSIVQAGPSATTNIQCYGTQCPINIEGAFFGGNAIRITSDGDMTIHNSNFEFTGGRPKIELFALHGNIFAGPGCDEENAVGFTCEQAGQQLTREFLCSQCGGCFGRNKFRGTIESNFRAFAEKDIDLSNSCIYIAENIWIMADGRNPDGSDAPLLPGGWVINLGDAELRDDFGKTGTIKIYAHTNQIGSPLKNLGPDDFDKVTSADGAINIDNGVFIDDGANGGGPDPQRVSDMNLGTNNQVGNCGEANVPPGSGIATCPLPFGGNDIPQRGWIADPVERSNHNALGVPRCDS